MDSVTQPCCFICLFTRFLDRMRSLRALLCDEDLAILRFIKININMTPFQNCGASKSSDVCGHFSRNVLLQWASLPSFFFWRALLLA